MKNVIIIITILSIPGIFLRISQAAEDKRVIAIEMGESGQTVEFPMSPEEIAAEKAENARLTTIRQAKLKKPEERKKVIEMGESGQTLEFPMSPEEIATEDADNARLVVLRKTRFNKSKKSVISFEMAESGIIIEFPVTAPEISEKNQHR